MRKSDNKGYSFIELILTLAVFSIIMLAIILMMRTSLASYRNGLFEAQVQEEAQIVANQISDILVDSTRYVKTTVNSGVTSYEFIGPVGLGNAGSTFTISYDGSELKYTVGSKTQVLSNMVKNKMKTVVALDGTENQVVDKVGFKIDGLDHRNSADDTRVFDNKATIQIRVEGKQGREYFITKDVFFRNEIENKFEDTFISPYDVTTGATTSNPVNTGSELDNIPVYRFKPIDLSAEYNFITAELKGNASTYFELKKEKNKMINDTFTLPTGVDADQTHIVLKVAEAYEKSQNFNYPSNGECYIEGLILNYDGSVTEVSKAKGNQLVIHLDAAAINQETKVIRGMYERYEVDNATGYPSNIAVKGIDIYNAIESGLTVKCKLTFNGTTVEKELENPAEAITQTDGKVVGGIPSASVNEFSMGGNMNFAVSPNPLANDIVLTMKNGFSNDNTIKGFYNNNTNPELKIELTCDGKSLGGVKTYYLNTAGNSVNGIN